MILSSLKKFTFGEIGEWRSQNRNQNQNVAHSLTMM